ncbi:MAG: GNAT family N-acetyltransferase [Oligoflexales bacterium]
MLKEVSVIGLMPMRIKILRPNGPESDCKFPGDHKPNSRHIGLYDSGFLAGIGSVIQESEDGQMDQGVWRIRGVAVEGSYRKQGIGSKIVEDLVKHVKAQGGKKIWCNARTSAIRLYQKHEFSVASDEFILPVIGPHFRMKRNLHTC